jgi:hypothetical protein
MTTTIRPPAVSNATGKSPFDILAVMLLTLLVQLLWLAQETYVIFITKIV